MSEPAGVCTQAQARGRASSKGSMRASEGKESQMERRQPIFLFGLGRGRVLTCLPRSLVRERA